MKANQLMNALSFAIKNRFPILIKGAPGIGKSDIVARAAKDAGAQLIISHPVVSDPTDYKGLPTANGESAKFLPFGELDAIIKATEPTVFFLDDLGQAPASVQAACMQLILARRINEHKISDNVVFIAATNRKEDKAGVSGLLEPVKSRFASIVELEVDLDSWFDWAFENDMPIELISFLKFKPGHLHEFKASKDIVNSSCPRTLAYVGKMQKAGLSKDIEIEMFKGACGESFAVEYAAFLKVFRSLPSIDEIILNPKGAPVPDAVDVTYALSGALAVKMNKQTIDSICTYMERLKAEIAVATMTFAIRRDRTLAPTAAFIKFSQKYGNLFSA